VQDGAGAAIADKDVVSKIKDLSGDLDPHAVKLSLLADPHVEKDDARADVRVTWTVSKGVNWEYQTVVPMKRVDDQWRVVFSPKVIHPQLVDGDTLAVHSKTGDRGVIADGAGQPIFMNRPVVVVGVQPSLVTDLNALADTLD